MEPLARLPSWLLVALQFVLAGVLIVTTEPLGHVVANAIVFVLVVAATFVGVAALAANRPGNFRIRPEPKPGAQLVTDGIYRYIRHPMYSAFLTLLLASIAADPRPWRWLLWAALLVVLLLKLKREETLLAARFPGYPAYTARTKRLLPGIY